jgi:D-alanyl-lipoteichoic acid acyltransferase DltB (MBOAT superfamily)
MLNLLLFLGFSLTSVIVYWFLIPSGWRNLFLFICSLFFIVLFSVPYTVYFLFNIVVVYSAGISINQGQRKRKLVVNLILFWLVGNLCFFKYANLIFDTISKIGIKSWLFPQIELPGILLPFGFSYITFRLIHYIVEVYRNNSPRCSFVEFALYILFFPTFLAGPVERIQNFYPQLSSPGIFDISNINYGLFRIISGLVKKIIIADNLSRLITPVLYSPQAYTRGILVVSVYCIGIQIYMDFSGYTDIAIGVARLFGYRIIENFNKPFFQKNIALFWRNWHISVYSWIRDYFFLPLFGYRASNIKIYIGIFCTMMVFQLWHKGNINFLILGIYHGSGLVIWQFFQELKRRYSGIRRIFSSPYLDPLSTFFTFSFVSFGFIFFNLSMDNIKNILSIIF